MNEPRKRSLLARMRRIEGQVCGVSRMIDEDRYCVDVITQLQAIRAALKRVEEAVLKDHVAHCVEHAIATGDRDDQRRKVQELLGIIERL